MSMPAPGTVWPPKPWDKLYAQMAESHVWLEGSSDALTDFYSGGRSGRPAGFRQRAQAGWQAFWGHDTTLGQAPRRLHMPVPADLATTSANMLFSSPPTFTDPAGNKATQSRLDMIANTTQFHSELLVAGEICSGLGDVYQRVVWDDEIVQNAFIDTVDGDRAIPEFKWGRLVAVTFWTEYADGHDVWRHLERYAPERVEHALFKGTPTNLGRVMPLQEHPATAGLAADVDAYGAIATGTKLLAAVHIPNQRPNFQWRGDNDLKNVGRPDISRDLMPLFSEVDETWTSLKRELRLAKLRLFASEGVMQRGGPGQGSSFDTDREVFEVVGTSIGQDGGARSVFEAHQGLIRVDEHLQIIEGLTRGILRRVGISPLTFGLTDAVAITAAETAARERTTTTTRAAKTRLWKPQLSKLVTAQLQIDAHMFGGGLQIGEDVEVEWSQAIQETPGERAATVNLMDAARAASTHTRVRHMHPDWDDQAVADEVKLIVEEQGHQLPDLGALTESDYAPADGGDDAATAKLRADTVGTLVRAGVTSESAADIAGLSGVKWTGGVPVTLRDPNAGG